MALLYIYTMTFCLADSLANVRMQSCGQDGAGSDCFRSLVRRNHGIFAGVIPNSMKLALAATRSSYTFWTTCGDGPA